MFITSIKFKLSKYNSGILLTFNPRNDDNHCNMSDNKCEELATEIRKLFEGYLK